MTERAATRIQQHARGYAARKNGKGVGEGVRWNPDRTYPHKLVDGRVVGSFPAPGETTIAISHEEAERIAADLGVPVPAPARVPD